MDGQGFADCESVQSKSMRELGSPGSLVLLLTVCIGVVDLSLRAAAAADACEVVQNPQIYNGKMISIRARVQAELEDFEAVVPSCPKKQVENIWLEYAKGPKSQPTTWCCGDLTPSDPLGLIQDAAFRMFDRSLRARRNRKPEYAVTATLSGRFQAVPTTTCPDGIHRCPSDGGFGHFGMFASRMVIHSVSQVAAVRVAEPRK